MTNKKRKETAQNLIEKARLLMPRNHYIVVFDEQIFEHRNEWLRPVLDFLNGIYYGYPVCCVVYFVYRLSWSEEKFDRNLEERQKSSKWEKTRYIPCDWHWKKL